MDLHTIASAWIIGALIFAFILALSGAADDLDGVPMIVMIVAWPLMLVMLAAVVLRLAARTVKDEA